MRIRVRPVTRLSGTIEVPGDKSVSHRAALLGAVASGRTEITGYLEGEDCLNTLRSVEKLGVLVTRKGPGHYLVDGAGLMGLREPEDILDCGNSGTGARLLLGVLAGQPFWTFLTGDASLRQRPMKRVAEPLAAMGATFVGRQDGGRLPLGVRGARPLRAYVYASPVASAQIKTALLLAGLWAEGPVSVTEPAQSRDHTERMLAGFGARLSVDGRTVTITPGRELRGQAVAVPGDISSAASGRTRITDAAELRVKESDRIGAIAAELGRMGARVAERPDGLDIEGGVRLRGATVGSGGDHRMAMALVVAGLIAEGETVVEDTACINTSYPGFVAAVNSLAGRVCAEELP